MENYHQIETINPQRTIFCVCHTGNIFNCDTLRIFSNYRLDHDAIVEAGNVTIFNSIAWALFRRQQSRKTIELYIRSHIVNEGFYAQNSTYYSWSHMGSWMCTLIIAEPGGGFVLSKPRPYCYSGATQSSSWISAPGIFAHYCPAHSTDDIRRISLSGWWRSRRVRRRAKLALV